MQLCATPYDTNVGWWYFTTPYEFDTKYQEQFDKTGTEEYEIQFIDGDDAELALSQAVYLNQVNFRAFMEFMDQGLSDRQYAGAINRLNNGYSFSDVCSVSEDELDEDIMHESTTATHAAAAIEQYADELIEEHDMLNGMPENLKCYFDTAAFARDMGYDGVSAFEFCGVWYVVQ